jgi:hypothetical protein
MNRDPRKIEGQVETDAQGASHVDLRKEDLLRECFPAIDGKAALRSIHVDGFHVTMGEHIGSNQAFSNKPVILVEPKEAEQQPLYMICRRFRIEDQHALAVQLRSEGNTAGLRSTLASLRFDPSADSRFYADHDGTSA